VFVNDIKDRNRDGKTENAPDKSSQSQGEQQCKQYTPVRATKIATTEKENKEFLIQHSYRYFNPLLVHS